jgi:hypothetical protein
MMYSIRYPLGRLKKRIIEWYRSANLKTTYDKLPNQSLARLIGLKNSCKGKRCFIVGNGPSLKEMDLGLLKNDFGIVFNGAFELREYFQEDKLFHAVEDRLVLEDHQEAINALSGSVFLPSDLLHFVSSSNPIVTEFHRSCSENDPKWPPFVDIEAEYPVFFWGGTVAYFGLQLALWLGFDEVFFIGVDLSYTIPESVIQKGAVLTSTEDDPNHYKPGYFGAGLRWHVPNPERMSLAFERVAKKGVKAKIYNAGIGGNLNCFERVKYDDLF